MVFRAAALGIGAYLRIWSDFGMRVAERRLLNIGVQRSKSESPEPAISDPNRTIPMRIKAANPQLPRRFRASFATAPWNLPHPAAAGLRRPPSWHRGRAASP